MRTLTISNIASKRAQLSLGQKSKSLMAGWGLIAAALVFTVEIFISPGQTFNWYLFYLSTPFLLGIFLWKSSSPVKAIPLPIFIPLSMAGVGVMGFLQNQQPRDAMVQNMVFQFKIADDVALETLRVYFVVSVYLLVFALMTFRSQFLKITINNGFDIKEHQPDQAEQNKGYVWLSLLSVSLYIQQVGLRNLIYRDTYIDVNNHIQSRSLVNLLFVVQITLIGICAWKFDESVSSTRTLFRLILFGFVLEGFADGSRVGAIYILIWCFLTYVKNPKKIRAGILLLSFPTSILFCNLMVWFRSKPFHGLLPQLNYLRDFPWSSASEWYTTNVGSYSFNITAYAAYLAPKLPTSSFWVSVNPLPGFLTNWYEIAPSLRFNFYAPYTTIGELTNYGYLFLIAFSLILGSLIGYGSFSLVFAHNWRKSILPAALFGSTVITLALSLQYNLRSTSRFLIISIIFGFLLSIARKPSSLGDRK